MTDIVDITQPLRNGIPPWPGDTEFHFEAVDVLGEEDSVVNVGKFKISCHTGTHIDAPFHYDDGGQKVHELDLGLYVGRARVVDLSMVPNLEAVGREALEAFDLTGIERVLIKTNCWTNRNEFPEKIVHLTPAGAEYLGSLGVRLVGVDVPSVDGIRSKGYTSSKGSCWTTWTPETMNSLLFRCHSKMQTVLRFGRCCGG